MANMDSVSQFYQNSFGNFRITNAGPVSLSSTGNAVIAMPILSGGTGGTTQYIVRRITVANLTNTAGGSVPSAATANISFGTTNDGANLVTSNTVLTNLTGAGTYADLTLASAANTGTFTANALFLNVNTSVANAQALIAVYGDIVVF